MQKPTFGPDIHGPDVDGQAGKLRWMQWLWLKFAVCLVKIELSVVRFVLGSVARLAICGVVQPSEFLAIVVPPVGPDSTFWRLASSWVCDVPSPVLWTGLRREGQLLGRLPCAARVAKLLSVGKPIAIGIQTAEFLPVALGPIVVPAKPAEPAAISIVQENGVMGKPNMVIVWQCSAALGHGGKILWLLCILIHSLHAHRERGDEEERPESGHLAETTGRVVQLHKLVQSFRELRSHDAH